MSPGLFGPAKPGISLNASPSGGARPIIALPLFRPAAGGARS